MAKVWNKHIFSAELPYEKDQPVTLFIRERFKHVDVFIMSLGQMSNIPPARLFSYVNGKQIKETVYIKNNLKASGFRLYCYSIPKALVTTTFDLFRALKAINFTCDIFYAQHFLPAFVAIVLRRWGILKCKKIAFRMFDFFPIPSEFLRGLYYRGIDKIQSYVRQNIDEIWYTTPRLLECDKERYGPLPPTVTKRLLHGYFFRRIAAPPPPPLPPLRLAFLGSLRRDTGAYHAIDAVNTCIKHDMKVELHIIGSGPEEKSLKDFAKKKHISQNVVFYGFEDRGEEIAHIFSRCHLALGLYPAHPSSANWFLTSGRCRRYVAQRLPIVVSTVPYFAKYIHDYGAGLIVDNDPVSIWMSLKKVYDNPELLDGLRNGIDKLYHTYKADKVLDVAFHAMVSSI